MKDVKYLEEVKLWNDLKLKQACKDILEFKETSLLPNGPVKDLSKIIFKEIGNSGYNLTVALEIIKDEVLKRFILRG